MSRLLLLVTLGGLGSGCAALGSAAAGALGQSAFAQASPLAPLLPTADRYVPRSPEPGELTLRELAFRHDRVTLVAGVSAGERRGLRRARLAPATAAPCTAGWVAETVWLDQQRRWDRPLGWSGDHELELSFRAPGGILREPAVLDLLLVEPDRGSGTERCLRRPLGGPTAEDGFRRKDRTSAGGSLGLVWASGSPAEGDWLFAGVQASGSLGVWFGRWRLGGQLDVCVGNCDPRSLIPLPVAAMVERLLYLGRRFTLAAAVGYQPGRVDDLVSLWRKPGTWVHGPRAALRLLGPRPFAGSNPREGYASRGLSLFVSRQFHTVYPAAPEGRPTRTRAWLFGLEATAL